MSTSIMAGTAEIPTTKNHNLPGLHELWCEKEPGSLRCLECSEKFGEEAIVRTARLEQRSDSYDRRRCSRTVRVLDKQLQLYDRHLRCCSNVDYIAVSHVWNPAVSDAHVFGRTSSLLPEAQHHVFESLGQLGTALFNDEGEDVEFWFDYVCVPQWQDELKVPMLGIISDIFHRAKYTLVHLSDVNQEMIDKLHHGTSSDERIDAITGILNASWFSRVWTAMEYVRSETTKVMTKDFRIVQGVRDVFMTDTNKAWNEERKLFPSVHALEARAGIGNGNIVPWSIGPLEYGRLRKRLDYGNAFSLLSRRGCRSSRDFFHAFTGVIGAELNEPLKTDDAKQAIVQIATACLKAGDYSPLLIVPRGLTPVSTHLFSICGYHEVASFGLGGNSGFPDYHDESVFESEMSTLKLEKIGAVIYTFLWTWPPDAEPFAAFLSLARATLAFTGPDVEAFVDNVGPRLYKLPEGFVSSLLSDRDRCRRLAGLLDKLINQCKVDRDQWESTTSWSAQDYTTAKQIAALLGIMQMQPTIPHATPLDYLWEHGGTMHGNNPASMIAAECSSCKKIFMYRVGFHRSHHAVKGAIAYRIAGYSHEMSTKDGLGILVKDGEIVGRLIWASRACECRVTGRVRISLRNLPLHHPRAT